MCEDHVVVDHHLRAKWTHSSSHKRRRASTVCCLGAHSSHRLTCHPDYNLHIDTITTLEAADAGLRWPKQIQTLEWID